MAKNKEKVVSIKSSEGLPELPEIAGETQSDGAKDVDGVAGQRLKSFLERIERLEEEKSELAEDIREVYAEAKSVGFDTKTMRKVIKLRKMDSEKRTEEAELLSLYCAAVGMQGDFGF